MRLLARIETGRVSAIVVLVIALAAVGALFALLPSGGSSAVPASGAPASSQSAKVTALLKKFPGADQTAALVIFSRTDKPGSSTLSAADKTAIAERVADLAAESTTPQAVRPQFSDDETTALAVVPITKETDAEKIAEQAKDIRATSRDSLPSDLQAQLTGPLGFQSDTANAFAGADVRLLLITAGIVALLLIITYRSPVLWLVPLTVVAIADGLARIVVNAIAARFDIAADASILGILSVLVFGAGTNYALLLIARYRDELLSQPDRRQAMRTAVTSAGPAILASGSTVILSLLTLLFAQIAGNRALGIACAIGIAIALLFALLVLPAALVVFGRGLFWPFVPRVREKSAHAARPTVWSRIGNGVVKRPVVVAIAAVAVVGILSSGLIGAKIGLSQTDQLIGNPESVQGEKLLSKTFPGGFGSQTSVLAPTAAVDEATTIAEKTTGVSAVRAGASSGGRTELQLTLSGEPQSQRNFDTISELRQRYSSGGGAVSETMVGGTDATALDVNTASAEDRALLIPLILAVVFVVLTLLLRSLVAPLLLIASVVATFFAALGAGNWLFQNVFGFAAFDTAVVLYAFLFLVALGVDYNIFLSTRAREERALLGARGGMLEALTRTGGVITSAGVLLAAVFVVLGVLPVVALAQIGTIVCIGVLLDTLVVRTLLVPALAFLFGERFWWPSRVPVNARS
ncbi:MMPL family transporter [Lacisediminihabitans changchengi]|uniref:MMPL family transporter n=1 Tax=Lacisediminihabitans changchengi TaxID=2787634 RepID=A0A934SNN5_9MICO|nr:MMPL family transporter [Lacisediminihabitans changchengi]MBK4348654.1 MMPL family transporter [Lacisediminihabitans changchengi]